MCVCACVAQVTLNGIYKIFRMTIIMIIWLLEMVWQEESLEMRHHHQPSDGVFLYRTNFIELILQTSKLFCEQRVFLAVNSMCSKHRKPIEGSYVLWMPPHTITLFHHWIASWHPHSYFINLNTRTIMRHICEENKKTKLLLKNWMKNKWKENTDTYSKFKRKRASRKKSP